MDVEHCTALWEKNGAAMKSALEVYHRCVLGLVDQYHGYVAKSMGDAFVLAFGVVEDAARFAVGIQEALMDYHWDEDLCKTSGADADRSLWSGLKVRVGCHTGDPVVEIDALTQRTDYYGLPLIIAASLNAAAEGGQTLLSDAAFKEASFLRSSGAKSSMDFKLLEPIGVPGMTDKIPTYSVLPKRLLGREDSFTILRKEAMLLKKEAEQRSGQHNTAAVSELPTRRDSLFAKIPELRIDAPEDDLTDVYSPDEDEGSDDDTPNKPRRDAQSRPAKQIGLFDSSASDEPVTIVVILVQRPTTLPTKSWRHGTSLLYSCIKDLIKSTGAYPAKDNKCNNFHFVFRSLSVAVRFTLQLQRAVMNLSWDVDTRAVTEAFDPETRQLQYRGLTPKIGIHRCNAEATHDPLLKRSRFNQGEAPIAAGLALNARGGEILVSENVQSECAKDWKELDSPSVTKLIHNVVIARHGTIAAYVMFPTGLEHRLHVRAEFAVAPAESEDDADSLASDDNDLFRLPSCDQCGEAYPAVCVQCSGITCATCQTPFEVPRECNGCLSRKGKLKLNYQNAHQNSSRSPKSSGGRDLGFGILPTPQAHSLTPMTSSLNKLPTPTSSTSRGSGPHSAQEAEESRRSSMNAPSTPPVLADDPLQLSPQTLDLQPGPVPNAKKKAVAGGIKHQPHGGKRTEQLAQMMKQNQTRIGFGEGLSIGRSQPLASPHAPSIDARHESIDDNFSL